MQIQHQEYDHAFIKNLAFRRQFVLGPEHHDDITMGWDRYRVNDRLWVSCHPDLPCIRVEVDCRSLTLLGYILDPRVPERTDKTILENLLHNWTTIEDLLSAFDPLVGRWAIIYTESEQVVVFHDATGMRQVYFAHDDNGTLWCGSSPCLLSRIIGLEPDLQNRQQLLRDGVFSQYVDHFWPGNGSAFLGIQRLLPNHYLDAITSQVSRFWPRIPMPVLSEDKSISLCAATLTGSISAAAARFPLALAITAGLDSRLLLAASRGVAEKLSFYTLKRPGMHSISPDVRVPRRLLGDLGLRHRLISVQRVSSGLINDTLHNTFYPVHQSLCDVIEALIADPPRSDGVWVTVNGNVCETARCFYNRVEVSPDSLANKAGMGNSRFAAEQFWAWYESAQTAIEATGINPWDLFYWEQKMGGWLGTIRTEFDLAEEVFTPYNCRSLLECMLGVDESLRSAPQYQFFRKLISTLWPELLEYPVNPKDYISLARNHYRSTINRVLGLAKAATQRLGIYPLYAFLKQRIKSGNKLGCP
jgi:hypothetical protein